MTIPHVTVHSSMSGEFMPDYAVFTVLFTAHAASKSGAVRHVNRTVRDVKEPLNSAYGIVGSTFSPVNSVEQQTYDTDADMLTSDGWDASIMAFVQLASPVAETIANLLTDAGGRILYVSWVLSDEAEAYRKVRVATVSKAKAAAEDYALAAGLPLGALRSIVDSGNPLTDSLLPTAVNAAPPAHPFGIIPQEDVNLDPSIIRVTVTVDVSYELGPAAA